MLGDQIGRQAAEDLVKLVGALGRLVFAAGHVRHLPQGVFVDTAPKPAATAKTASAKAAEPAAKAAPAASDLGAVGGAEADGVDANTAVGRLLSGHQRGRPGVA